MLLLFLSYLNDNYLNNTISVNTIVLDDCVFNKHVKKYCAVDSSVTKKNDKIP